MNPLKRGLFALSLALAFVGWLEAQAEYRYKTNLNQVKDDLLRVELATPKIKEKEVLFHLPKIVPGTYSIYDFGRFVTEVQAFDAQGKALKVERVPIKERDDKGKLKTIKGSTEPNTWKIKKANKLAKLVYTVEDTWDTKKRNVVFEPAGTNFDVENQVFVFNNHGIFGYFRGYERLPFYLEVERPENLFGGTGLERKGGDAKKDIFFAPGYNELVDGPILFAKLDTAMIDLGGTQVLIHTHSPTGRVKSKDLVKDIQPILEAQKAYLGGKLPVNRYAFLIFLNPEGQMYLSNAAGALEHSYSSFYALFEGEPGDIAQTVRDVAAHEFFHIITPLMIHSEEIHYFDFIEPKMSKHLWLYEGVTEYSAQHVQVKQGLVSVEHFLGEMSKKMRTAEQFKDHLAFTEMSLGALDTYKSQYNNVYLKGALIGMAIDLKLRQLSKGAYGIQDMMRDLGQAYGIEKPFKDAELFDEIVRLTKQPALGEFLNKHVAGKEPLPIPQLLASFGISYEKEGKALELSLFGFDPSSPGSLGFDAKSGLLKVEKPDFFGSEKLGLQKGDLLKVWNGEELNMKNVNGVLGSYAGSAKEGKELKVLVLRKNEAGVETEVELSAPLEKVEVDAKHILRLDPNARPEQIALRKAWLGQ